MGRRGYPPEFRRKVLDLVERDFIRSGPNQLWVTDITEHHTREGKLYCAVMLDVFARRVVGSSIDASPTATLVTNALGMAIDSRQPPPGAINHSDQGVQFGLWAFTDCAKGIRGRPKAWMTRGKQRPRATLHSGRKARRKSPVDQT